MEGVDGEMKITDGESYKLKSFGKEAIPTFESRAEKVIEWLIGQGKIKIVTYSRLSNMARDGAALFACELSGFVYFDEGFGFAVIFNTNGE